MQWTLAAIYTGEFSDEGGCVCGSGTRRRSFFTGLVGQMSSLQKRLYVFPLILIAIIALIVPEGLFSGGDERCPVQVLDDLMPFLEVLSANSDYGCLIRVCFLVAYILAPLPAVALYFSDFDRTILLRPEASHASWIVGKLMFILLILFPFYIRAPASSDSISDISYRAAGSSRIMLAVVSCGFYGAFSYFWTFLFAPVIRKKG